MALRIEDYALIGDTQTAALVGRDGSIDWMCVPRFDSGACFAALLGEPSHGRWQIAPRGAEPSRVSRRYRQGTMVLETTFETDDGAVRIVDCMGRQDGALRLLRLVEGIRGEVPMHAELIIRFDYGSIVPWVMQPSEGRLRAIAGADALVVDSGVPTHGVGLTTVADFVVRADQKVPFVLTWHPSHEPSPAPVDAEATIRDVEAWWRQWSCRCNYQGDWRDEVHASLVTLKALTFAPTGAMVAAVTTSLPEFPGGVRNWDYRYCWLRDATFILYAFHLAGYRDEAIAWRDWLLRAVAGDPARLQIMYGVAGERRLPESTLDWLPGYEGSHPVRTGNSAVNQLQLDVYGEVTDALFQTYRAGLPPDPTSWRLQLALLDFLERSWSMPDEGLWEVRGPRQHFTHSKVMAWVAFDRAVKSVETLHLQGPTDRWRRIRDHIHDDVCAHGYSTEKQAFTQAYGSPHLDASLLLIPQVGFLPARDPRMVSTVAAIERELMRDGFVMRYPTVGQDGLPAGEGVFLACSFWLADCYALMQRMDDARALFEKLLSVRNDVGLLSEEYDPVQRRQLGNFPQAFSHVGLVNTAFNLTPACTQPARHRQK
jgi:GH15 family glucan-1,4-alpha-glucosidase